MRGARGTKDIEWVAVHEAGHAVVAAYLGAQPFRVALKGYVQHDVCSGEVEYLYSDRPFDNLAIATAGHAANSLSDPNVTFESFAARGPWDILHAHYWLNVLGISGNYSDKLRMQLIENQWVQSREILRLRWERVTSLTDSLINTYETAKRCAPTPDGQVSAEISGAKLTRLLESAK